MAADSSEVAEVTQTNEPFFELVSTDADKGLSRTYKACFENIKTELSCSGAFTVIFTCEYEVVLPLAGRGATNDLAIPASSDPQTIDFGNVRDLINPVVNCFSGADDAL